MFTQRFSIFPLLDRSGYSLFSSHLLGRKENFFPSTAQIQPGVSPKALTTGSPHAEDTEGRESWLLSSPFQGLNPNPTPAPSSFQET